MSEEVSVDLLSDVLRAVRLTGAYFYPVEAAAPWSVFSDAALDLVPRALPGKEHLISYHILVEGSCWGGLEDGPLVPMKAGDVIVFPHGDAHRMSSAEVFRPVPRRHETAHRYPETLRVGPEGPRDATFLCGFLGCDVRPFNPLLAALPRCMHLKGVGSGWLSWFPRQAIAEARRAREGSETVLTRMAELMFIEAVRQHLEHLPAQQVGWLAGIRDEVVGPALLRLHERPAHRWTLAELARATTSSRTVLAERFSQIIGVSPILYLTRWRLQLAAEQLLSTSAKVATIGLKVGYESEAAFSRAFKRETGMSPAAWRNARLS